MEHLANCHGEWNIVIATLYSLPFLGIWLKTKFGTKFEKTNKQETDQE